MMSEWEEDLQALKSDGWSVGYTRAVDEETGDLFYLVDISRSGIRFRDDAELAKITSVVSQFDLIAIQEARDYAVLDRMKRMLPGWDYRTSPKVGRGQKEIYTFFFKKGKASP